MPDETDRVGKDEDSPGRGGGTTDSRIEGREEGIFDKDSRSCLGYLSSVACSESKS